MGHASTLHRRRSTDRPVAAIEAEMERNVDAWAWRKRLVRVDRETVAWCLGDLHRGDVTVVPRRRAS